MEREAHCGSTILSSSTTTDRFRPSSGDYLRQLGPSRGIIATAITSGIIVLACLIAGIFDWRWWVAGLAVLLNVAPVILALQYLAALMHPLTVRTISAQQWTLNPDSTLRIDLFRSLDSEVAPEPRESFSIRPEEIVSAQAAACGLVLRLRPGAPFAILILDPEACTASLPFDAWCKRLRTKIINPEADKIVE